MSRPDFIGIGAQKSATTWIYDVLQDHPEIGLSEMKELDFFSRYFDRGYQWYENHFSSISGKRVFGEVSPSYLNEPAVPARVADYNPAMKIIVSFREPVSRLISNHKHEVRIGHFGGEDLSLEAGIRNNPSYIDQGRYATHLANWLAHVPREQLLVLFFDDILAEPERVTREIYDFLGVDSTFVSAALHQPSNIGHLKRHPRLDAMRRRVRLGLAGIGMGWIWESAAKHGLRKVYRAAAWVNPADRIPPVSSEQQHQLKRLFVGELKALERLLGCSLNHWRDDSSGTDMKGGGRDPDSRPFAADTKARA